MTSDSTFVVDSCPPNDDCRAELTTFEVHAPGLVLPRFGLLVQARWWMRDLYGCHQSLEVTSMESWAGLEDHTLPDGALMLAVVDGNARFEAAAGGGPFADSPYTVDRVHLGCSTNAITCGDVIVPGDYALDFALKASPQQKTRVEMGETRSVDLPGTAGFTLQARNLRSYETGYCDDYWNYAYYLVGSSLAR